MARDDTHYSSRENCVAWPNSRVSQLNMTSRRKCPYLDRIRRTALDFDFEKICSQTLSPLNVYCCLECGKFFGGKAASKAHSLDNEHYVWVHLENGKFFCFPDDYQIVDEPSLDDISFNLRPTYSPEKVRTERGLYSATPLRDLNGNAFYPGLYGLSNLNKTDYVNSVFQALQRVKELRDFFLVRENWEPFRRHRVVRTFGDLTCQFWSDKRFKSTISPHEFLQVVYEEFKFGTKVECGRFLAWLLHSLHVGLSSAPSVTISSSSVSEEGEEEAINTNRRESGSNKRASSSSSLANEAPSSQLTKKQKVTSSSKMSVIERCFQGKMEVTTRLERIVRDFDAVPDIRPMGPSIPSSSAASAAADSNTNNNSNNGTGSSRDGTLGSSSRTVVDSETREVVNFNFLALDFPEPTGVLEDYNKLVQLSEMMKRYDGVTVVREPLPDGRVRHRRFKIVRYPKYLTLHLKRFSRNQFSDEEEKNRCVVSLPIRGMKPPHTDVESSRTVVYDLVSNVSHESQYFANVSYPHVDVVVDAAPASNSNAKAVQWEDRWFKAQDEDVVETMPQMVEISESCLNFYRRRAGGES